MTWPRYLLDTGILSDLIRNPAGNAARRIAVVGDDAVCTSIIVACELRYGVAKKASPILREKVAQLLSTIAILPLDIDVDQDYGEIRAGLESAETLIQANDYLIAAHALSRGLVLVTGNVGEFSRITGLEVEDWLKDWKQPF